MFSVSQLIRVEHIHMHWFYFMCGRSSGGGDGKVTELSAFVSSTQGWCAAAAVETLHLSGSNNQNQLLAFLAHNCRLWLAPLDAKMHTLAVDAAACHQQCLTQLQTDFTEHRKQFVLVKPKTYKQDRLRFTEYLGQFRRAFHSLQSHSAHAKNHPKEIRSVRNHVWLDQGLLCASSEHFCSYL